MAAGLPRAIILLQRLARMVPGRGTRLRGCRLVPGFAKGSGELLCHSVTFLWVLLRSGGARATGRAGDVVGGSERPTGSRTRDTALPLPHADGKAVMQIDMRLCYHGHCDRVR